MTAVSFTVPGKPQPKQRARKGRYGWYTPEPTRLYEERVRQEWMAAGRPRIEGPVRVRINAFMRNPTFKRDGDADNIGKSVLDALQGYAFGDDALVVSLTVEKYPVPPLEPRVWVEISSAAVLGDAA